jgi:hypothetical protein
VINYNFNLKFSVRKYWHQFLLMFCNWRFLS